MKLRHLARVFAWAFVTGFLADALRRCFVVEAWSIAPVVGVALWFAVKRLRAAWRHARRNQRTEFIRPSLPSFDDVH